MSKTFLAVAVVFVLEPIAAIGPIWRVGIVVIATGLAVVASFCSLLRDQLRHG